MTHYLKLSVFTLMFVVPAVSHATVVYSNFGTSFGYNTSAGNIVGDDGAGDNLGQADTFTPGSTAILNTIEIALSCQDVRLCPTAFTVSLESDSGDAPATILESFTVAGTSLGVLGVNNAPITLTSVLNPTLVAGTQYWLAVTGPLTDMIVWNWNSTGDSSDQSVSLDGGASWISQSGQTPSAYEIDGTIATPEPGTLLLLLGGGLLIGLKRQFKG
jgi:hypothetical protein